MKKLVMEGKVNQMNQTPIEAWIEEWGTNLDWEAKVKLREAVQEMTTSHRTVELSIDASKAFEVIAKTKAELEQVIALQKEIAAPEPQLQAQPTIENLQRELQKAKFRIVYLETMTFGRTYP